MKCEMSAFSPPLYVDILQVGKNINDYAAVISQKQWYFSLTHSLPPGFKLWICKIKKKIIYIIGRKWADMYSF